MRILALETSCDETAAALLETKAGRFELLSNIVSSQVKIHAKYGGIVPEVAARKQMEMIVPVIERALKEGYKIQGYKQNSNYKLQITNYKLIPDYIAVTHGPGLITSLRVGVEAAKTLAYAWKKPLVVVNHLEGHIYASAISNFQFPISKQIPNHKAQSINHFPAPNWKFPVLALIVSGGHTQLVLMKNHLKYKIVGETLDDAAGEAFDKVAKILEIGYPGGPIISKLAQDGDPKAFDFPRPMMNSQDLNFSFSGLKTSVLYLVEKLKKSKIYNQKSTIPNLCASFQQAVVDVLVKKTIKAAEYYKAKTVILGGGVAANKELREQLGGAVKDKYEYHVPELKFSGDNAAMIAIPAYYHIKNKNFTPWEKVKTDPNLRLK